MFYSEFLAEESQEKFWDFVEANQNIESDHDGNIWSESHLLLSPFRHAEACRHVSRFFIKLLPFVFKKVRLYWISYNKIMYIFMLRYVLMSKWMFSYLQSMKIAPVFVSMLLTCCCPIR